MSAKPRETNREKLTKRKKKKKRMAWKVTYKLERQIVSGEASQTGMKSRGRSKRGGRGEGKK